MRLSFKRSNRNIPELLAPAGNPAMLHAAVSAGADAVYLGMGAFNARRNADNFDDKTFAEACDYAHLRGVRIYVTMNTVILPDELDDAVGVAKRCWKMGADAFIVQDLGLLIALMRAIPDVRIHASTQMNIHSADGVAACAQLGVSRVTLARELSLEEIAHLCEVAAALNVQIETFAHGALCVCYSGQCLMSSMIGARSANRGLCAQACRLPYELVDLRDPQRSLKSPGPHLLSPKDLCTIDSVGALAEAGVASLKIEGRMKSPEYVHTVVGVYREALDRVAEGAKIPEGTKAPRMHDAHDRLASVFSRGFTEAYLGGDRGNDIMSYGRPNNRGQFAGRVKRVRNGAFDMSTELSLVEGDLLEVWTSRTNVAVPIADGFEQKGKTVTISVGENVRDAHHIHEGDRVFRVRSAAAAFKDDAHKPSIPIIGSVCLMLGLPLHAIFRLAESDEINEDSPEFQISQHIARRLWRSFRGEGGITNISGAAAGAEVEQARTKNVTASEVEEHVDRLGSTPFSLEHLRIRRLDEGVGIGFSQLHRIRAEALEKLQKNLLAPYSMRDMHKSEKSSVSIESQLRKKRSSAVVNRAIDAPANSADATIVVLATNPEVARAVKRVGADAVYVPALNYKRGQASYAGCVADSPSQAGFPKHCKIVIPSVVHDSVGSSREAATGVDPWASVLPGDTVVVDSFGALHHALELGAIPEAGPSLPIANAVSAELMQAYGVSRIWLTPELNLHQIAELTSAAANATPSGAAASTASPGISSSLQFGIKIAGAQGLMITEHCELMSLGPCGEQCATCTRRRVPHALRDRKGYEFPVVTDAVGRSHIYNGVELDNVPSLLALMEAGVSSFMIDATLMTSEQAAQSTGRLVKAFEDARSGGALPEKQKHATTGHLHRGVL